MSKYCAIQNVQDKAIFRLLEFFFLLEVKIKTKMVCKNNGKKPAPSITVQSTKIMFQENSSKSN